MSFFAVLLALALEQLKPLPWAGALHGRVAAWVDWTRRNLDAGDRGHAWLVWCAAVLGPGVLAWLMHVLLGRVSELLALLFDVLVLYVTLGFRQFSHHFTAIRAALEAGDEWGARRLLAQWRRLDASEWPRTEVVRHVVEHSLIAAHRHVFGVFFAYVVFSALGFGPMGAVVYRLAAYLKRAAARGTTPAAAAAAFAASSQAPLGAATPVPGAPPAFAGVAGLDTAGDVPPLAARLFQLIDRPLSRLSAFGFAVVGNFEDAIDAWRRETRESAEVPNEAVLLASAGGALGLRIGPAAVARPGDAPVQAATPQVHHLRSVVALVWRSVVLWMLLLALLSLANLVG